MLILNRVQSPLRQVTFYKKYRAEFNILVTNLKVSNRRTIIVNSELTGESQKNLLIYDYH